MLKRKALNVVLSLIGPAALIVILTMPIGPLAGGLGIVEPWGGIFDVGRGVQHPSVQRVALPDVISGAEVIIDEWGIPHIYADTVEDAFIALGYMHARDRLFQVVMQTYLAAGRISEVVGSIGVDSDKYQRTIGLAKSAEETYQWYVDNAATNPDVNFTLRCVHAHLEGMNAFIDSMTSENTPIEFKILGFTPQHFTPVDSFTWAKYMTWGLSGGVRDLRNEFIRSTLGNDSLYSDIFPEVYPNTIPVIHEQYNLSLSKYSDAPGGYPAMIVPPSPDMALEDEPLGLISTDKLDKLLETISGAIDLLGDMAIVGSNSWAVNGSKTATGEAMLANDPHLTLQAPSLWYEVHIVVLDEEDALNVQGGSLPGTPGILIGHTEHISWGMTNVGADVLDIFVEQLDPANSSRYMYNGAYREFEVRDEPIRVKGGGVVEFNVSWSVHGPCIDSVMSTYDLDEEVTCPNLAMNWTGLSITHEILTLGILNRANNLTDYYDAMYWWDSPPHNFIYADDAGNIAITVAGRFPIRQGYSGNFPITALNDSVGMISNVPYAYNPRSVNPSSCFLQSANQKSIDPASYPYTILGAQSPDYRGERIYTVLDASTSITVEDMMRLQADVLDLTAEKMLPFVLDAWDAEGDGNSTIQGIVNLLEPWDYEMETDIAAPTIWTFLLDEMRYEVFDEVRSANISASVVAVPVLEWVLTEPINYYIDDHTTGGILEDVNVIMIRALHRTAADLYTISDDPSDWAYGLLHTIRIDHLAGLTYIGGGPHRGSGYTVNVGGGWVVQHGPSRRMVVSYTPTPEYYTVYPGGQSQVMFSQHWDDLFDLWYTYDPVTQHYGYTLEYNYPTADAFASADDGTMIEGTIVFLRRS
jgi:penicillin amidase